MNAGFSFNRPWSWMFLCAVAIAGIIYTCHNFDKANSLINLNIEMDRELALQKAADMAKKFRIGPEDFKQAAAFRNDYRFQNFVELEAGGLDTFTSVLSNDYYQSYHWSVRHFKEQDAHEAIFWFKPNGDSFGFVEKIPESVDGKALTEDEALGIAEHHAVYNWDVDLSPYELVEQSKEEQISGRVDHSFVYERIDESVGEGKFRVKLVLSGDKLTAVDYHVKIPEDFDRRYSEMRSANETIQTISTAAIALLYGLLGVALGIFVLMRRRRLIWKPAVYWGLGIAFASLFLLTVNSLPFSWFSYDTSTSQSNFLLQQLLGGLLGALGFGAVMAISFMAAEGLGRMAFPKHVQWWKIWSQNSGGSKTILGQTIGGYLFAIIIVAFDVFFYVSTTTHLGWWSPAGNLSNPNILATYLPWLDSIAISLQAGFWEEALFRAVPIAGVFILTKGKKSRNFWIIVVLLVQTLIFGAGHANYPQQPSYARVVEMIIPFIIMGIIYIYFGILPAVVAHYAVDVFWISLPLWVTSTPGIWVDRILVVLFFLVPVLIVLFYRVKNKKWVKVPDNERNAGWKEPEKTEPLVDEEIIYPEPKSFYFEKWTLLAGIIGFVLWIIFNPFKTDTPILELSRNEAKSIAVNKVEERYDLDVADWSILTSVQDNVVPRDIFVWREGNKETYKSLLNKFLAPPHWSIRFVKTSGTAENKTEEYTVRVLNSGEVFSVYHRVPEKWPGKSLSRDEAQSIADSTLHTKFRLNTKELKEISVSPTRQENRTDWKFVYADTTHFPLKSGQGRYLVDIAGNEVTNTYSYVYVPEDWMRKYNENNSKLSITKTIGMILVIGTIVFGLVLCIIRWTRKKININLLIWFTGIFAGIYFLDTINSWNTVIASFNTSLPYQNFIITVLIGIVISGIFLSLSKGIFFAVTPKWLPVSVNLKNWNLLYAIALGFAISGLFEVINKLVPKNSPSWLSYEYLNSSIPVLGISFSGVTQMILTIAFVIILFLGIHQITRGFTRQKIIGSVVALLAGLSVMSLAMESYGSWLLSGFLLAVVLFVIYYFFIRFHFEWLPVSIGIFSVMNVLSEMIIVKNSTIIVGGILSVFVLSILIYAWYKTLLIHSTQKR